MFIIDIKLIFQTTSFDFSTCLRSRGALYSNAPWGHRQSQLLAVGLEDVQVSVLSSHGDPWEHSAGHHPGGSQQQSHHGEYNSLYPPF